MADPLTAYGRHLYDILPEVYRERDRTQPPPETLHLQKYLDAHGALLDRLRLTLQQLYADHFPDVPEEEGRVCQSWIIPYLADLVGAVPASPFPDGQRDEVAKAVRWSKAKGTLPTVAEIVETVAQSEAELQEGWTRVARTIRIGEPIRSAASLGEPPHPIDAILADDDLSTPFTFVHPQIAARHPGLAGGTIDVAVVARAVSAPRGAPGVKESRFGAAFRIWPRDDDAPVLPLPEPTGWRPVNLDGAPCFPDSFEDTSPRTVDVRSPDRAGRRGRYHPKAVIVHLPTPYGLCPPDPTPVAWPTEDEWKDHPQLERVATEDNNGAITIIRNKTAGSVEIEGDLSVGPDGQVQLVAGKRLRLEKLRIPGKLSLTAGALELARCAVRELAFDASSGDGPADRKVKAKSVLFDSISGDGGHAELEYCTILTEVSAEATVFASEVIFPDAVRSEKLIRVRYSRLPRAALAAIADQCRAFNTDMRPLFVSGSFCSPGAGVLKPVASAAILEGAEDGTEMGAFHDWRHAALRSALVRKLADFLPMGVYPVIVWDDRLLCTPPERTGGEE